MNNNFEQTAPPVRRFRRVALLTVGAVLFLIFVGGLVRMTGSGMGCPDWPKCFGQWVPPTDISELPADYKTRFQVAGKEIADFDAFKTWVEYLNRLLGVLIGLFVMATVVTSWPLRKQIPGTFRFSLVAFVLVVITGLVGAVVVATHLHTGTVTIHMLLALSMAAALMTAYLHAWPREIGALAVVAKPQVTWAVAGLLGVTLLQIVLGTQVREAVDETALIMGESARANWLSNLGGIYKIHRSSHYLVIGAVLLVFYLLKEKLNSYPVLFYTMVVITGAVIGEVMLGLGMHHFGLPPILQPLHLLFAALLFVSEFCLLASLLLSRRFANRESITKIKATA